MIALLVYRTTLAAVLIGPAVSWALAQAGVGGLPVPVAVAGTVSHGSAPLRIEPVDSAGGELVQARGPAARRGRVGGDWLLPGPRPALRGQGVGLPNGGTTGIAINAASTHRLRKGQPNQAPPKHVGIPPPSVRCLWDHWGNSVLGFSEGAMRNQMSRFLLFKSKAMGLAPSE